jgi:hypothetical protein
MRASYFVVLVMGDTESLRWEFEHLVATVTPSRILLVVPAHASEKTWKAFAQRLSHLTTAALVPEDLPFGALAIAFHQDWKPVIFAGTHILQVHRLEAYREIAQWVSRNISAEQP